ncbi:MAG: hypothetical protein ACE5JU_12660 [Candidatus Binatia bacterium]
MLLILRIIHVLSAAVLVGFTLFSYFVLRPVLQLIPPAHAVVVAQRVGTLFTYTGWTALGLLFLSGVLRLYYAGDLVVIFSLDLYAHGHGRSLAIMILSWFVTVATSSIMTFVLRPRVMKKLAVNSNPSLADVEKRRTAQIAASTWLERLQLVIVIFSTLALIAGVSIMYGGLF